MKVLYLIVRYMPFISMSFVFMLDGKRKFYIFAYQESDVPLPSAGTNDGRLPVDHEDLRQSEFTYVREIFC